MRVRILASADGVISKLQYASAYLVNDCVAIDAGCLGMSGTPQQQSVIRHVFLTHSHADHIASLPIFLENVFERGREPVTVYGASAVLDGLQRHVFNDVIWPDFVKLSIDGQPLLKLAPLGPESPVRVGSLCLTPVAVDHIVPAYGYIVSDGSSTVIFCGDSGPTERIWQLARKSGAPLAMILEASFPNALHQLATISGHLTPRLFAEEVRKVPEAETIVATHIKVRYHDKVVEELLALGIPGLVIGEAGREYEF